MTLTSLPRGLRRGVNLLSAMTAAATLNLLAAPANAANRGGGGGLPWEAPLALIARSLTGPVAGSLALIALFVSGGMLVWGGEMGDFARRRVMMCLAISVVLLGAQFLPILFGAGAVA